MKTLCLRLFLHHRIHRVITGVWVVVQMRLAWPVVRRHLFRIHHNAECFVIFEDSTEFVGDYSLSNVNIAENFLILMAVVVLAVRFGVCAYVYVGVFTSCEWEIRAEKDAAITIRF